jgi:uncharacterized protein (DUF433 family)
MVAELNCTINEIANGELQSRRHWRTNMKLLERITVEPGQCGGQPCIRGKRMRVTDVLDLLSHGASHEEILADYSFLEPEDILAAIAYASRLTDHVVLTSA